MIVKPNSRLTSCGGMADLYRWLNSKHAYNKHNMSFRQRCLACTARVTSDFLSGKVAARNAQRGQRDMDIGFIGLGNMGQPMARRLIEAGHKLVVYNTRDDAVAPLVALGAQVASSPARHDPEVLKLYPAMKSGPE